MDFKDYYKILGVDRKADAKAIGAAFRRLARQYHPDVNKDPKAADRFKEINEAFQVLSDPEKRSRYDQMLDMRERGVPWEQVFARPGAGTRGQPQEWTVIFGEPGGDLGGLGGLGGFSEFFRRFFADLGAADPFATAQRTSPFGRTQTIPRQDLTTTAEITLEEAFSGTEREVEIASDGRRRRLRVAIPPGVRSGQKVRVRGGADGADVYVQVQVRPHSVFTREGDDVVCEIPISLAEALLGAEIEVPTLTGKAKMRIPPDTQNGQVFRLRGQGMPRLGGQGRGDQLVRVHVVLPRGLSAADKEKIAQIMRAKTENPRAGMGLK
ncbi:MAG: DnaJ C-terminal domain-containing protein [Armatimonadota bacterium]|nr:DnaJ C-terminal domain-containing protein [Armatimonadota bacterium]MDR5697683.1 DnaJ C-terminal domain-containing protein [Armatimonadota bacterium]